jgi:hypothetical protein
MLLNDMVTYTMVKGGRGFDSRICHGLNPSDLNMVLRPNQPLIEMSARDISWGRVGRRPVWIVLKSGRLLEPSVPVQ